MSTETEGPRTTVAESYRIHRNGLDVDGKPFPWHVHIDGPRVQPMPGDDTMHILWLPIIVDAVLPIEADL